MYFISQSDAEKQTLTIIHPNSPQIRKIDQKPFQAGIWKTDVKVVVEADGETGETVTLGWVASFN